MVMGQYSVQGDMGVSPTHNPPILASSPTRPTDAPSTAVAADLRFLDYRRSRWGKQAGRDRSMFCSSKAARDDEAGDVQGFRGPGGIPDAKGATDEEYDGLDIRPGGPRAGLPAGDHRQSLPPDGHHRRHQVPRMAGVMICEVFTWRRCCSMARSDTVVAAETRV